MKVTIELDLTWIPHRKLMEAFLASQSATDTSVGEVASVDPTPEPAPEPTPEPAPEPAPVEVPVPLKQQLAEAFNAATAVDAAAAGKTASAAMDQHGANSDNWPEETTKQVISQLQAIATIF